MFSNFPPTSQEYEPFWLTSFPTYVCYNDFIASIMSEGLLTGCLAGFSQIMHCPTQMKPIIRPQASGQADNSLPPTPESLEPIATETQTRLG